MDQQHPIPQDVTGFQFKLIGDMTIKQFAYLAGGVILAWLTYSLPLFWLIKFPLIFLFGMLGVALAFIPIEGRPFDIMLTNFLKALISPNQFVFQKIGHPIFPVMPAPKKIAQNTHEKEIAQQDAANKLQKYLTSIHTSPKNALDEREMRFLGTLPLKATQPTRNPYASSQLSTSSPVGSATLQPSLHASQTSQQEMRTVAEQPIQTQNIPQAPHLVEFPNASPLPQQSNEPNEALEKEATILQQELAQAKQEEVQAIQSSSPMTNVAHEKVIELEKELADILGQKDNLQKQLITLKKELAQQKQQVFSPSVAPVKQTTQNVRIIAQGGGRAAGLLSPPEAPNLLTGIIKDPRNNSLPNILVEVKDRDGNPVRAFKTNGLGQFAAATQLANGVYTITFEDPTGKNKFDAVEIPVTGIVISPLEVISVDEREELRKELFK